MSTDTSHCLHNGYRLCLNTVEYQAVLVEHESKRNSRSTLERTEGTLKELGSCSPFFVFVMQLFVSVSVF